MALKTKKQTSQKKKASKNTKNTKKSLLSKVDLKSSKTRLLVVILAFALVGGGLMVYRSYAARTATVVSAGELTAQSGIGSVIEREGRQKKDTRVAVYSGKNESLNITLTSNKAAQQKLAWVLAANAGKRAQMCMSVRVMDKSFVPNQVRVSMNANGVATDRVTVPGGTTVSKNATGNYTQLCTSAFTIRKDTRNMSFHVSFQGVSAGKYQYPEVRVGGVSVEIR